jgi:hypothetical protein
MFSISFLKLGLRASNSACFLIFVCFIFKYTGSNKTNIFCLTSEYLIEFTSFLRFSSFSCFVKIFSILSNSLIVRLYLFFNSLNTFSFSFASIYLLASSSFARFRSCSCSIAISQLARSVLSISIFFPLISFGL